MAPRRPTTPVAVDERINSSNSKDSSISGSIINQQLQAKHHQQQHELSLPVSNDHQQQEQDLVALDDQRALARHSNKVRYRSDPLHIELLTTCAELFAVGAPCYLLYPYAYTMSEGNRGILAIIAPYLITYTLSWTLNVIYMAIDFTKAQWAQPYKVQPGKWFSPSDFLELLPNALFNQFVLGIPVDLVLYAMHTYRGSSIEMIDYPSVWRFAAELALCIVCSEITEYYSHRLFHHPLFYKRVHKLHHRFTVNSAIVTLYASPIEYIFGNMMLPMTANLLCGSHYAVIWAWRAYVICAQSFLHAGYRFPYLPKPDAHEFHHVNFIGMYGGYGVLDWFHGTDHLFNKLTEQADVQENKAKNKNE